MPLVCHLPKNILSYQYWGYCCEELPTTEAEKPIISQSEDECRNKLFKENNNSYAINGESQSSEGEARLRCSNQPKRRIQK